MGIVNQKPTPSGVSEKLDLVTPSYLKLVSNLEDMVKVYRVLLDIVRKEKELLIKADIENLLENNKTKEACLYKVRGLDSFRERYARELAGIVGADTTQPRLIEIAQRIPGERGDKLRSFQSTLELVVSRAQELNKENETYAQSALQTLNGALTEVKETLAPKKTYGPQGKMSHNADKAGHFVRKEG